MRGVMFIVLGAVIAVSLFALYEGTLGPHWPTSAVAQGARGFLACGQSGRNCFYTPRPQPVGGALLRDAELPEIAECVRRPIYSEVNFKALYVASIFRCRSSKGLGEFRVTTTSPRSWMKGDQITGYAFTDSRLAPLPGEMTPPGGEP